MKRIAVFAHWDKNCVIEDYVIEYLRGLKEVVRYIIFVSDCNLSFGEIKKLDGLADVIIAKTHHEYDFGSYKRGYIYAKENNILKDYDELILANDSNYAPLFPFAEMFSKMSGRTDFWGILKNYYYERIHLQSYFLVLGKPVFESDVFYKFITSVKREKSKLDIISNYEVGLTEVLSAAGFSYEAYCGKYKKTDAPQILRWKELIKKKHDPFIKTSLLRLYNSDIKYPLFWKSFLKKTYKLSC